MFGVRPLLEKRGNVWEMGRRFGTQDMLAETARRDRDLAARGKLGRHTSAGHPDHDVARQLENAALGAFAEPHRILHHRVEDRL